MISLIPVPYQDNGCDCGVFVCRYAYNLYMMRHQKFTKRDYKERPPFTSKITRSPAFQFDMSDIARIREEIATLIDNLSKLFISCFDKQNKAAREAKRVAKQKDHSMNVKNDAHQFSSKSEGKVEGDCGVGGGLDESIGNWDQFSANKKKFNVKASTTPSSKLKLNHLKEDGGKVGLLECGLVSRYDTIFSSHLHYL